MIWGEQPIRDVCDRLGASDWSTRQVLTAEQGKALLDEIDRLRDALRCAYHQAGFPASHASVTTIQRIIREVLEP